MASIPVDVKMEPSAMDLSPQRTISNKEGFLAKASPEQEDIQSDAEKRAMRKFGLILLPQLLVLALLANLDRTNIGNAKIFGLSTDLHLKGNQFNTISTVFFPTYIIFEVPWVIAIKRYGINRIFAITMIGWGAITLGTGFIQNYGQAIAVRVLLGIFEASVIPCFVFTISMIWEPSQQARPVSVYYIGACISGAFGGLIAYSVDAMGPKHGLAAWRWLFIIEGIITLVLCSLFIVSMPVTPEKAWFLNESEQRAMEARKQRQLTFRGEDVFEWGYFKKAMKNSLVWLGALSLFANTIPLLGLTIFLPTLLKGMGFGTKESNYLTIPVYLVSGLLVIITTTISDRYKFRGFILMAVPIPTIIGYGILIGTSSRAAGYVSMFLVAIGMLPYNTLMLTWISSNISPDYKRAVSFPVTTALSNIAGILSSNIYPASQSPRYRQGSIIALAFELLALLCVVTIYLVLRRRNQKKDKTIARGLTDDSLVGDESLFFRYEL